MPFEGNVPIRLAEGPLLEGGPGMLRTLGLQGRAEIVPVGQRAYRDGGDELRRSRLMQRSRSLAPIIVMTVMLAKRTAGAGSAVVLLPLLLLLCLLIFRFRFRPGATGIGWNELHKGHRHVSLEGLAAHLSVQAEDALRVAYPPSLEAPALRILAVSEDRLQSTAEGRYPTGIISNWLEVRPFGLQGGVGFSHVPPPPSPD